jgi:1-acyl-sn-glycerol-3-phosphate acyltransferase
MSLFLTPQEMWDRPLGGNSQGKQVPHWLGNIIYVIAAFICKIITRYHVHGRQRLRDFRGKSGVVVVSNHTSFLDVAFLWCAVRPSQWLRLMARDSLFENHRVGGQVMARVGAFPVKRDTADLASVKRAARMLKNGEVIGIFPEGTRRGKGAKIPALHGGAALIARMGKAPIMPSCIRNADKVKIKGEPYFHFPTVYVEFGEPLYVESFDFLPKEKRLDACIWYAMRESFALYQQVPADQVDMKALFPDNEDFSQTFKEHPITTPVSTLAPIAPACASDEG